MAGELGLVETFLIGTLRSLDTDAEERWYNESAPSGAGRLPGGRPRMFGLIRWQGGDDTGLIQRRRASITAHYIIEVLLEGQSFEELAVAEKVFDDYLDGYSGTVPGGRIIAVVRSGPWKAQPVRDGVYMSRLGGRYKVLAEAAAT